MCMQKTEEVNDEVELFQSLINDLNNTKSKAEKKEKSKKYLIDLGICDQNGEIKDRYRNG
jgi:hypothetical protein